MYLSNIKKVLLETMHMSQPGKENDTSKKNGNFKVMPLKNGY